MNHNLEGNFIYGDDMSDEAIVRWHEEESESYFNLINDNEKGYTYKYHSINALHGFRYIENLQNIPTVLGIGAAYGSELKPILHKSDSIFILESTDKYHKNTELDQKISYISPGPTGAIPLEDNSIDLATCFGVLHHIPNVSFFLQEISRVLKPKGYALIREPIISMGDWSKPRPGLTKNERGIPLEPFKVAIGNAGLTIRKESLCMFSLTPKVSNIFNIAPYNSTLISLLDAIICKFYFWKVKYHATTTLQKLRPTSVFFVLSKYR